MYEGSHPFKLPGSFVKVCPLTSVNSKSDILRTYGLITTGRNGLGIASELYARACNIRLAPVTSIKMLQIAAEIVA